MNQTYRILSEYVFRQVCWAPILNSPIWVYKFDHRVPKYRKAKHHHRTFVCIDDISKSDRHSKYGEVTVLIFKNLI